MFLMKHTWEHNDNEKLKCFYTRYHTRLSSYENCTAIIILETYDCIPSVFQETIRRDMSRRLGILL